MKSNTSIHSRRGGSLPTSTSLWSGLYSRALERLLEWKLFTGTTLRLLFRKDTTLRSRHYTYRSGTVSRSASSTPGVEASFPRLDIAAAKVLVKHQVKHGLRKAPTDLLVLPAHALEDWYDKEAIRYLQEQKAVRQS